MRATVLLLGLLLAACEEEEKTEPVDTGPWDEDGDGFVANEDCDDGDAAIFPGALEFCNGEDDDCDGEEDEGGAVDEPEWCPDQDLDGYGVDGGCVKQCERPGDNWSDNTLDCDDTNAFINPEGLEICDLGDRDEDCNGYAEDEDEGVDPSTLTDYYPDADSDGYGDMYAEPLALCDDPSTSGARYADNGDDCDDESRRFNPDEEEDLTDGLDNNCNGCVDEIEGAPEEPGNGVDDDCDSCTDETEDDGRLNWYYSEEYDVWWDADWCNEIEACPDCDWSFDVQFLYDEDTSVGGADVGLNYDFNWTLGWGSGYPDTVWYYYAGTGTWYPIFEADYGSGIADIEFEYGYWSGYADLP